MFTLSGVYSSLSFRCKCQILSGGCGLLGYITGTEGIVMKQDKILKILKGVYNRGDPPLSIPNREVKPLSADGTALWWESRLAPNCESSHDLYCDCFFYVYENSPRGRSFWAILESRLQYPVCSGCRGCHIFLKKYSGKFCPLLLSRSVINNCVTRLEYLYFSPLSIFRTFSEHFLNIHYCCFVIFYIILMVVVSLC